MVTIALRYRNLVAQATTNPASYVGVWKMMAQDKRVGTLELMNYNGRLTGTLTNAHASMDSNGKLVSSTPSRVQLLSSRQAFHKACS